MRKKSFDVALYGHLVFDEVYNETFSTNVGGIANVWKALKNIDQTLSVYVCPVHFGSSKISIKNNEKLNDSKLNLIETKVNVRQAPISHVAYVNELNNIDFISEIQGIKTADVCTTGFNDKVLDSDLASEFDIIFVADDQQHLIPNTYKNILVVHGPKEVFVYESGENKFHYSNEDQYLTDINVLGAGDYFAACYIYGTLYNRTYSECAELSQKLTTKYLKECNEKT